MPIQPISTGHTVLPLSKAPTRIPAKLEEVPSPSFASVAAVAVIVSTEARDLRHAQSIRRPRRITANDGATYATRGPEHGFCLRHVAFPTVTSKLYNQPTSHPARPTYLPTYLPTFLRIQAPHCLRICPSRRALGDGELVFCENPACASLVRAECTWNARSLDRRPLVAFPVIVPAVIPCEAGAGWCFLISELNLDSLLWETSR